jgi:hypothetical protein
LHPLVESKKGVVDQRVEEDKSLDIFEIERIFSLARILINLRRCCLQLENLDKLIFVSIN